MSLKTISIKVSGKVQGVWFRNYTMDKAIKLGICGYVKNMIDESVYILATGTETQLQELIQWCYTGSPKSRVEKVEANEEELQIMKEFTIKR